MRGFTLIELIIVIAIVALLAVVAMPNLLDTMERGRQSATLDTMRTLATALERYAVAHGRYPEAKDFAGMSSILVPEYLKELPTVDAWKNPYQYTIAEGGGSYTLRSLGKDGLAEPPGADGAEKEPTFDTDLVLVDGVFTKDDQNEPSAKVATAGT